MSDEHLIGQHNTKSLTELQALAESLAHKLLPGNIVCLQGDLGAGKTTFAQYLGKALGVCEEITSPTYTMLAEYEVFKNLNGISKLVHIDAYRESLDTNYVREILETVKDRRAVVLIEWPEKLGVKIEGRCWNISITAGSMASERIITATRVE